MSFLLPPNLKYSVTILQRTSLNHWFTPKCDICCIWRIEQRLEIRINQHIPSSIRTLTSDLTRTPRSYNSTSDISRHLLATLTRACVYSPNMVTILETSANKMQLSIQEALVKKMQTGIMYPKAILCSIDFQ